MQLFAGELTNQNREYYKVNDNKNYTEDNEICCLIAKTVDFCVLSAYSSQRQIARTVHIAQRQHLLPFR